MPETHNQFAAPYHFAQGFVAGVNAMCVSYPSLNMKIRRQAEKPFTWDPKLLYRGFTPFAAAFGVTLATQNVTDRFIRSKNPNINPVITAGIGGLMATITNCPAEQIVTTMMQENYTKSFSATARSIMGGGSPAIFYNTFKVAAIREALYAGIGIGGARVVDSRLQQYQFFRDNPALSKIASSTIASVPATACSQPADVIKNEQHLFPRLDLSEATKQIYRRGGIAAFQCGFKARFFYIAPALAAIHLSMDACDQARTHYKGMQP